MKKVKLLCFALVLSLSATVVNAQSWWQDIPLLTEQEMNAINPSILNRDLLKSVLWSALTRRPLEGRPLQNVTPTPMEFKVGKTMVHSLNDFQRNYAMSHASAKTSILPPLSALPYPNAKLPQLICPLCSTLKYADFWRLDRTPMNIIRCVDSWSADEKAQIERAQQPPIPPQRPTPPQPLTEQEMSKIIPSTWDQSRKMNIFDMVRLYLASATSTPTSENQKIAYTLVTSLTPEQKTQLRKSVYSSPGVRADALIACSGLKYADFWAALGLCKQ